jgi:hypothetical protein
VPGSSLRIRPILRRKVNACASVCLLALFIAPFSWAEEATQNLQDLPEETADLAPPTAEPTLEPTGEAGEPPANPEEPPPNSDKSIPLSGGRGAEIEALGFDVSASKKSSSLRVYLFDDINSAKPRAGRIMLLRQGKENVMAFRILKNYPGRNQFAAAKIKTYSAPDLPLGEPFRALLKVADLAPLTPNQLQEDATDLKDL